jgi:hypothetical protein
MTFTFRMRFSGLCVFVPEQPFSSVGTQGGNVGSVAVLLRNLTVPERLIDDEDSFTDPHFPLLEFDWSNRRPASTRDRDFSSHSSIFDGRSYCFLRGEALRILTNGNGAQGVGVTTPPYDLKFKNLTSLRWVAEMAQVSLGQETIRSTHLTQMPDGDSDTAMILARIDLNQGRLSTSRLSDGRVDIMKGKDSANPEGFPRQVAIELLLEIPGCEEEVVIDMQRRDDGKDFGARQLVLGPATGDPTDNVVEVQLHHREIDGFIGVPLNYLERKDKADFQVYYKLSEEPDKKKQVTVRPQHPGSTPVVGTDHTGRCPPTAMSRTQTG